VDCVLRLQCESIQFSMYLRGRVLFVVTEGVYSNDVFLHASYRKFTGFGAHFALVSDACRRRCMTKVIGTGRAHRKVRTTSPDKKRAGF
jgi:hypothetical protein